MLPSTFVCKKRNEECSLLSNHFLNLFFSILGMERSLPMDQVWGGRFGARQSLEQTSRVNAIVGKWVTVLFHFFVVSRGRFTWPIHFIDKSVSSVSILIEIWECISDLFPFLGWLSLRQNFRNGLILIDFEAKDLNHLIDLVNHKLVSEERVTQDQAAKLKELWKRKHRHQFEGPRKVEGNLSKVIKDLLVQKLENKVLIAKLLMFRCNTRHIYLSFCHDQKLY